MLDKHNLQLKALNNERENKLKTLPNMLKNNEELNDQINDYENKIENMKDEYEKKIKFKK